MGNEYAPAEKRGPVSAGLFASEDRNLAPSRGPLRSRFIIVAFALVTTAATGRICVSAPLDPPATRPSTRPTPADLASPRSALLAFERLVPVGGAGTAACFFSQSTPCEQRAAFASAEVEAALARLEPALADRYGDAGMEAIVQACGGHTADDIRAASVDIQDGDTARVIWAGGRRKTWFVKDAEGWKIDTADLLGQFDTVESLAWYMKTLSREIDMIGVDLQAGKDLTAKQVSDRINRAARR